MSRITYYRDGKAYIKGSELDTQIMQFGYMMNLEEEEIGGPAIERLAILEEENEKLREHRKEIYEFAKQKRNKYKKLSAEYRRKIKLEKMPEFEKTEIEKTERGYSYMEAAFQIIMMRIEDQQGKFKISKRKNIVK